METIKTYKKKIVQTLKDCKIYSPTLMFQVDALASALMSLSKANRDIEELDSCYVTIKSRYGEKMEPHPAFRIQRDAMAEVSKQMKQLCLTVGDVVGKPEARIPLDDLVDAVNNTE